MALKTVCIVGNTKDMTNLSTYLDVKMSNLNSTTNN